MKQKKWISIVEYVDIETGEIIPKSQWEREEYNKKTTINKIECNEKYNIKKSSIIGERSKQHKFDF